MNELTSLSVSEIARKCNVYPDRPPTEFLSKKRTKRRICQVDVLGKFQRKRRDILHELWCKFAQQRELSLVQEQCQNLESIFQKFLFGQEDVY